MFAQHAIACVLCELLLELFLVFFQHENRFRYKFFDIVQFSRSCTPQPCGWRPAYCTTEVVFCQALFFRSCWTFWTWTASDFSELTGIFQRLLVLFSRFSAGTSEVILLSQRLALKYNTIRRARCQHFFCKFFQVFSRWLKSASSSWILQVNSFVLYNVLYKGAQYRQWPLLPCGKHYFLCADCQEVSSQILFRKFSSIFGESYKTQNVVVLPLTYH